MSFLGKAIKLLLSLALRLQEALHGKLGMQHLSGFDACHDSGEIFC